MRNSKFEAEIGGDLPAALCVARNRRIWSRAARVTAPKVREQMSHVPGSDHPAACWTNSRSPKTTDKSAYGDRRPAFEPDGRRRGSNQPRDSGKAPMRPRQNILPRARARAWRRVQITVHLLASGRTIAGWPVRLKHTVKGEKWKTRRQYSWTSSIIMSIHPSFGGSVASAGVRRTS